MLVKHCNKSLENNIADKVLHWFDQQGRKNLPWQQQINPYRVWLSEIMLQQTQVKTVIPYFLRFVAQFPTIAALAKGSLDEVLKLWTGLGYYARARNLQRTAKIITEQYQQQFPNTLEELINLPGIGRSTAGAILSIAFNQPTAILDGNVKRVLARFKAADQPTWEMAEAYLPKTRSREYTQALMDLGATVCTVKQPQCHHCPLQSDCKAHHSGQELNYPAKKAKKTIPVRQTYLLMLQNSRQEIFLEKRPPTGIWSSLWSFPECNAEDIQSWCKERYQCNIKKIKLWPRFRHTFSHYHLDITPVNIAISHWPDQAMDDARIKWCSLKKLPQGGFAAPIKRLLEQLQKNY